MTVRPRDLMVSMMAPSEAVGVAKIAETESRVFPDDNEPQYRLTEVARTKHHPEVKGLKSRFWD